MVKKFNEDQKCFLEGVATQLGKIDGIQNMEKKVLYFKKDEEFSPVVGEFGTEEMNFLNYYWCEFTMNNQQYKVSMFYKDFDHGSGNIHILPGAVQVWKKVNECEFDSHGFCEEDLRNPKKDEKPKKHVYKCLGGKPYYEYGWKPLYEQPYFWDKDNIDLEQKNVVNSIIGISEMPKSTINSKEFYNDVLGYCNIHCGGSEKTYYLLKFTGKKRRMYYKTGHVEINEKKYGFFTKYDGEEVQYNTENDETEVNPKGPHIYNEAEYKWLILDKSYVIIEENK